MNLSYKQKFITLFLAFGSLIVAISFTALFYIESSNIKEEFFKSSKTITVAKQELFESFFSRLSRTSLSLTDSIAREDSTENFYRYASLLVKENSNILKITLFDEKFLNVDSLDARGSPKADPINTNLQKLWFSDIKTDDEGSSYIYVQNPFYIGEQRYAISIVFDIYTLFEALEKSNVGFIHLIDEDGNFIIYKDSFSSKSDINLDSEYPEIADDILFADYYIGKDMYSKKLEIDGNKQYKIIFQMREDLIKNKRDALLKLSLYILLAVFIISLPIAYLFSIIPDRLNRELKDLNESLERRVEEEVALRREKEKMVVHQSKMAAMGEMIGAIAHQWRQPLNTLGLIVQNIPESVEYGEMDLEEAQRVTKSSMKQISFMNQTITDFRNFFKKDKSIDTFDVVKAVQETLTILSPQLIENSIETEFIYKENDKELSIGFEEQEIVGSKVYAYGFYNEFKQVILNIINNAKDIILEKEIQGEISLSLFKEESFAVVTIEDNGGGIPEEIIDDIFTPYFSTKGDKGTGIGLDLAKQIIEKNMHGELSVINSDIGAKFFIKVPLSKDIPQDLLEEEPINSMEVETSEETPIEERQEEIKTDDSSSKEYVQKFFEDTTYSKENLQNYDDKVYEKQEDKE